MAFLETIRSSAALGHPRSPSLIDMSPSFMTAPSVMDRSWQWSMTGRSNILAYSIARRMSSFDCTQSPSSVIATTPALFSDPIGARASPFMPMVMQPVGRVHDREVEHLGVFDRTPHELVRLHAVAIVRDRHHAGPLQRSRT